MDNIEHDRLISSDESKDDKAIDRAIRPQSLKEYVGQKNKCDQMEIFIKAATNT